MSNLVKNRWKPEEDKVLKEYFGKISRSEIVDKLNRTFNAISYRAKAIGCESYSYATRGCLARGKNRHYSIDMSFFDMPNLLNCYWAGFIAADGCIKKERREVVIVVQERDRYHLQQFSQDCNYTGPIKNIPAKTSSPINGRPIRSGPSVRLEFYGVDRWIEMLCSNFNIIERKSLILMPPNLIKNDLALSFIAGYLDGDGCISKQPSISFRGTNDVLNWIKSVFDKIEPLKGYRTGREAKVHKYGKHPIYIVTGKRALNILEKIKIFNLPKIERKWNKIQKASIIG